MSQTEVQLIKDAVIVNADVSNSAAIDVSKLSGVMPLAGGTFTDDVTFTGASANIVFDKSDNALEFADQAEARFGGNNDLRLYHDGHSIIRNDESGAALFIGSHETIITNTSFNEAQAKFFQNGTVELYYDNAKKLETTSSGVTVSGDIDLLDSGFVELRIKSTNNDAVLQLTSNNDDDKDWTIRNDYSDSFELDFRYNNATRMTLDASGNLFISGNLDLSDNDRLLLGTGDDLQIYHDGSESVIGNGTGTFQILSPNEIRYRATTHRFLSYGNDETMAKFTDDGAAELYYDNSKKFETKTSGVIVQGSQLSLNDSNACIFFNTSSSGFGANIGIGRAATAGFHCTGSQVGDLVIAAEYGERIIFGLTTNTSGAPTIKMTMNPGGQIDGNFNDTSDANLKENIKLISDNAIADIKKLKPVTFDWKETKGNNNVSGFIAQEVKEVIPNLINGKEWSEEDQSSRYTINTIGVVAHVTKALQEAITKIETLETKVAALEAA